jgi:dihydrofolate reductase
MASDSRAGGGIDITLVAAMARGRVIGRDGDMPWHLPADLTHFKAVTLGHPVIMGRRTWDSIGRALPGRRNLVISRSAPSLPDGVECHGSLEAALAACSGESAVMIIGGGEIYRQALPQANRLVLTLIDAEIDGDTHFPAVDWARWRVSRHRRRPADEANAHAMQFVELEALT